MRCIATARRVILVCATALPFAANDVSAHALLAKSEPARRAVLTRPPSQVRLWFNERLEPAFCSITVTAEDGKPVTEHAARVSAQDGRLLELALPALSPGGYTVQYQVLSVDGHTVKASYRFTVQSR
jgi:copper resistance protein C